MLLNEEVYRAGQNVVVGNRMMLLGVLSQYYYLDERRAPAMSEIPTIDVAAGTRRSAVHLGRYVKARELLVIKEAMVQRARRVEPTQALLSIRGTLDECQKEN